ncbi:hypothetical protein GVX81_08780 [[Haemophilus] felis]|nr:hypothetical protein [[Haemophilus] felis]
MIVRFGGGNNGIAEYLEKGMKQGRMFSRDELDQRVILEGDLALTNRIIDSIQDKGQERYLHITLSFRENEISNDTLQDIVADYRELLMAAYGDDEFNFYAEAHLPKIQQVKDERTGEMIERKPHVHIVIPEVNLLTLNKLSPVGLVEKHERYLDSIQEFINDKYNLETPKDHVRNADMHHANVLSRIKGDFFGEKQQALKTQLVDEIAKGQINNLSEFQERLANFGEVKIRNKGKANQYFAVKIEGDKKFTNLNHPIFKESFITDKTLPYTKPSIEKINADITEWKNRVSREIKHVNFATQSFRKLYAAAEPNEKARLLADREANHERKYRHTRDIHKSRRTGNYKSNLDYAQKRQSRAASREASRLSSLSYSRMVHREDQRGRSSKSVLPENEHAHLRNGKPSNNSSLRRNDPSRTRSNERRIADGKPPKSIRSFSQIAKGVPSKTYSKSLFDKNIEKRPFITEFEKYQAKQSLKSSVLPKFSDSNTLSFMAKNHQVEQERKAELAKFSEIRKNIDPNAFLSHLERVYAVDPKKHRVTYAKDGSPRFSVNKRNLNASDFLTKHLHLEWKEAKEVLSYIYERQANKNINQEKLTSLEIQRNIKSFTFEVRQFEKDIKLTLHNFNVDNRNLYRGEKKRIYSRFNSPKIRNQELAIASFRAMQRQERINAFEKFAISTLEREKLSFQQSGYSNQALEDSTMAFKDSLNIALGNEFGRISPADEQISFADNFKQQQILIKRQLQEQQKQANTSQQSEVPQQQAFTNKALEEVMKLNNLGIAKKENGDIEYKRLADGKTVCTDVGNQMLISKEMQSPENIKTFLELAIDKYGNELKVSGSKEFKEMVVESAAAHNLPIILKPAALQEQLMERRKELELEAKAESLDSVSNEAGQHIEKQAPEAQAEVPQAEAQQQAPEAQAEAPQAEVQQQTPEEQRQAILDEKAYEVAKNFFSNPTEEQRIEIVELRRDPEFNKAFEQAEVKYWGERDMQLQTSANKQHSEERSAQSEKLYTEAKLQDSSNLTYDIKFKFDRKEAKYNVSINGESAKSVIAKDPNALAVLQQHPDIKKHNVPTSELQAGSITRTESMKGGHRPQDMKLNATGQEVKQQKVKDQGMER